MSAVAMMPPPATQMRPPACLRRLTKRADLRSQPLRNRRLAAPREHATPLARGYGYSSALIAMSNVRRPITMQSTER